MVVKKIAMVDLLGAEQTNKKKLHISAKLNKANHNKMRCACIFSLLLELG